MKVFALIVAFLVIGICLFFIVKSSIGLFKAVKERKTKKDRINEKGEDLLDDDTHSSRN